MPIPNPHKGEKRGEFVTSCMGDPVMNKEYPKSAQRAAICYSSWTKEHGKAAGAGNATGPSDVTSEGENHPLDTLYCEAEVTFEAAKNDGGSDSGIPRFFMVANTGAPMDIGFFRFPVVIDLAGLKIPPRAIPIRANHDRLMGVGHTTKVEIQGGKRVIAEGIISRDTDAAHEIISSAAKGFPWQASVGVVIKKMDDVESEKSFNLNGRRITGPVHIVREGELSEISFVDLGADHRTSVKVVASDQSEEGEAMNKKEGLAEGQVVDDVDVDDVDGTDDKSVKAGRDKVTKVEASAPDAQPTSDLVTEAREDAIEGLREQVTAEMMRVNKIRDLCASRELLPIAEKAIRDGWNAERTELEVLRAQRPKSTTAIHLRDDLVTSQVLEAACFQSAKVANLEKHFKPEVLEASSRRFRNGIGLQELLLEAAWANGFAGRSFKTDSREALRHAFGGPRELQATGLSNIDISGILSNVANKFLLEGFFSVESIWRQITSIRNVSDFKTVTSYRLIGTDQYEKIPPGGEIKHGTLGEQSFTNKAETYGLMLTIDRRDIINDDLGAITTVPRKLGRGSGLKINDVFWTVFMNNSAFFTSGNKNYISGAAGLSVLSIDGLTVGELTFMNQTDPDGKPIGVMPKFLLVPTALSALGAQLFKSLELRDTVSSGITKYPTANPHAGKFPVLVSRYLSNTNYTGYSTTAWYLLADPADLPVIETAFLNGVESPTIDSTDANFNTLGIQMRGYHDFGVALQDFRGGMMSKGAA